MDTANEQGLAFRLAMIQWNGDRAQITAQVGMGFRLARLAFVVGKPRVRELILQQGWNEIELTQSQRAIAALVAEGFHVEVVTVNYDPLLERALQDEGLDPTIICSVASYRALTEDVPFVVKIHGCPFKDKNTEHLVMLEPELAHPPAWVTTFLNGRLPERVFVYVGFSGNAEYVRTCVTTTVATLEGNINDAYGVDIDSVDKVYANGNSLGEFYRLSRVPEANYSSAGADVLFREVADIVFRRLVIQIFDEAVAETTHHGCNDNEWFSIILAGMTYVQIRSFCQRPIGRGGLLEILDRQLGTPGTLIAEAMKELTEQVALSERLALGEETLRAQLGEKEKSIEELRRELKLQQEFDSIKEKLQSSSLVKVWRLYSEDIEQFSNALKQCEARIQRIHSELVELSALVDSLTATDLVPTKEAEATRAEVEASRVRQAFVICEKRLAALAKFKEAISSSQVNLLTAILESHRPLIRSLYARMHPHPLFTDIDIEVDKAYGKGELYFKVFTSRGTADGYPSTIFSASQLNVLAVSVFLALNLRIESPLPITMLDDPIHSMDDLNVLGFCDVVRQLKAKRQLFVSTHNKDFYDLLLNKLRPSSPQETVKGFWFSGWSTEGPTILEETATFLPSQIQLSAIRESFGSSAA